MLTLEEAMKPGVLEWAIEDAIQDSNDPRHRTDLHLTACPECGQPDRCYGPWCAPTAPHLTEMVCTGCAEIRWNDRIEDAGPRPLTEAELADEKRRLEKRLRCYSWPGKKGHYSPYKSRSSIEAGVNHD